MENKKVVVVNMVDAQVGIKNPDFRYQANWPMKGSKVRIDKELLDDLMYEEGVKYLFDNGILYIDDMQDKIDLGLEEEGTTEPTNIVVWDEATIKKYVTVKPLHEFKIDFDKLSRDQQEEVARYMVKNELIGSLEKAEYVQKKTEIDVISAVRLSKANKEA